MQGVSIVQDTWVQSIWDQATCETVINLSDRYQRFSYLDVISAFSHRYHFSLIRVRPKAKAQPFAIGI